MMSLDWMDAANCRDHPEPDLFFPSERGRHSRRQTFEAAQVCKSCPVISECLAYKQRFAGTSGVWAGGMHRAKNAAPSAGGPQNLVRHGTEASAKRHRRSGETPCRACLNAERRARALRGGRSEIDSKTRQRLP